MRFDADISTIEILGHGILWILIILITVGIGAFFYPYSFTKFILNRSSLNIDGVEHRVRCDLDLVGQIGHVILWIVLTIVTLGLAYPFYFYKVWGLAIRRSELV